MLKRNFADHLSKGKITYEDGSVYEGDLISATPHGEGVFHYNYNNGFTYAGSFHYGVPQGKGELVDSEGKTIVGKWTLGQFITSSK